MTQELFREDAYRQSCSAQILAVQPSGIYLDRTVFYPTGGGQPGDRGHLITSTGLEIPIIDTIKTEQGICHVPQPDAPSPSVGATVTASLDWPRRYRHMRMHTALHLLCAVVGGEVTGGQITEAKSRLDFNLPGQKLDKTELTQRLNALVEQDHAVRPRWISEQDLNCDPTLVRTMSVQPPTGSGWVRVLEIESVDLQACGGTHVSHTAEIGELEVVKVESKGKQNRRISISFKE